MTALEKFFYWLPRVLSICFVVFISIFAFDVFSEYSGLAVILPLVMHLLPSLILIVFIAIAWKYDLVGVVGFVGFAVFYVVSMGLFKPISWYLFIALPSLIVGILYFISWWGKRSRKRMVDSQNYETTGNEK